MLSKERRIQRKYFPYVLNSGKKFSSEVFLLYVSVANGNFSQNKTKFAFSVSKKVCKSAVGRNRLRRLSYSVVENNLKNIKSGFLVFFIFKKGAVGLGRNKIEKNILELLSESSVLE